MAILKSFVPKAVNTLSSKIESYGTVAKGAWSVL